MVYMTIPGPTGRPRPLMCSLLVCPFPVSSVAPLHSGASLGKWLCLTWEDGRGRLERCP